MGLLVRETQHITTLRDTGELHGLQDVSQSLSRPVELMRIVKQGLCLNREIIMDAILLCNE